MCSAISDDLPRYEKIGACPYMRYKNVSKGSSVAIASVLLRPIPNAKGRGC